MTWKSRLTNGLTRLGVIEKTPQHVTPPNSVRIAEMKTMMEAYPGLSQPVWGPEISTVGAYSREGYTSKTFDSPAIPFKVQAVALQIDEDVQLSINHLASKITGGEHYVKSTNDIVSEYFEHFTKNMRFDTFDTILVKELLWYGNSVWKPRMGIRNLRSFNDLMHIPISSFVRIWWDRQRIPYKLEFRGAEYQGYHNPDEVIHFSVNPIDASVFGTGFGVSMTSVRVFQQPTSTGLQESTLPSLLERKYATQYNMQLAEQRYISHNVWSIDSASEEDRTALQSTIDQLDVGQDVVSGSKVEVTELGTNARNFNPQQFQDITLGPIMKAMNDFRGKESGSSQHSYANAKTSAILDEIGLSSFPVTVKEQLEEKLFRPWYETHPLPNPMTGGLVPMFWDELKFQIEFGEREKRDISIEDNIKLLELYLNAPIIKDPMEIRKLFEQAGLPLVKDYDVTTEQAYNGMPGMDNMMLPQMDMGGGPIPPMFDNMTMGSPPMDDPTYDSMMRDVRGDLQNNYKRGNQSQDWDYGRGYE